MLAIRVRGVCEVIARVCDKIIHFSSKQGATSLQARNLVLDMFYARETERLTRCFRNRAYIQSLLRWMLFSKIAVCITERYTGATLSVVKAACTVTTSRSCSLVLVNIDPDKVRPGFCIPSPLCDRVHVRT